MKLKRVFFFLIVGVSLASTNALASKDEQVIWEKNSNVYVKLVSQAGAQNQHPATVSTENLSQFLTSITYTKKNKSDPKPLFDSDQIDTLSKHVQNAFTKASTYQDINFSINKIEKAFGGLSTAEYFTAGKIFLSSSGLNLILGDVNKRRDEAYEAVYDPTNRGLVKYDLDHGSRNTPSKDYNIAFAGTDDASTAQNSSWLAIPVEAVTRLAALETTKRSENAAGIPADVVKREELDAILEQQTQTVRAEIKQAMTEVQASQTQVQSPKVVETNQGHTNTLGTSASGQTDALAERFKVLNQLRDRGLITEEEYQTKRKELLSEI
ncbi:MAG: SHOCT domain-containing protein [Pseudomonadota bacterium]